MPKFCDFGRHTVEKLWYARTKSRPSCCQRCLPAFKLSSQSDDNGSGVSKYPKQKKSSPIASHSVKQLEELAKYRPIRDEFLKTHTVCEINSPVCIIRPVNVHHVKPRRYYLCDVTVFKAACDPCNNFVEREHEWARERGFKIDHLGDKRK